MKNIWKILSVAFFMSLCLVSVNAYANDLKVDMNFKVAHPVLDRPGVEESASLASEGQHAVSLKEGHYRQFFDRLQFASDKDATAAKAFYKAMLEASDGDGAKDWLIDPTKGSSIAADGGTLYYVPLGLSFKVEGKEAYEQEKERANNLILHLYTAFTRDHPEVFWLDSDSVVTTTLSRTIDGVYEGQHILMLKYDVNDIDIRDARYLNPAVIRQDMQNMDEYVAEISNRPAVKGKSAAEKVTYFNMYLVLVNEYNTLESAGKEGPSTCRMAITALAGKTGAEGPVCEAYSKAMKVLCDRNGIPCCLENGMSYEGGEKLGRHMWNIVQIGQSWYAVDVTWDDVGGDYYSEKYLMVGSDTVIDDETFSATHRDIYNSMYDECLNLVNGPVLSKISLEEKKEDDPADHEHSYTTESSQEPTCVRTGWTEMSCTVCGAVKDHKIIAAKGHKVTTTEKVATLTADGSAVTTCSVCGTTTKKVIYSRPKTIALTKKEYICNGNIVKPTVKVTGADGKIIAATNYTVTYANTKSSNPGVYKVTVKFKGHYSGSKTLSYHIDPKSTTIKKLSPAKQAFSISWTKRSAGVKGYQIQIATNKTFTSGKKSYTIKDKKIGTQKIKKLKAKKKYYVRIRTYYGKEYSDWSPVKTVKTK